MLQWLALGGVLLGSLWLVFVGWLMWTRPRDCLRWLGLFASTWQINIVELGLRGATGLAMICRAPWSKVPDFFEFGGSFIVLSSLAILLVPRRWHAAYAVWWSNHLPVLVLRMLAPVTVLAGGLFAYLAL